MTIASELAFIQYPCNGVTTQFSYNNKIFTAADLVVTLIDTLGNLHTFVPSGFNTFTNSATGLSYTIFNVDVDTGCFIIFTAAPTSAWTLDLRTSIAELQTTSIKNQGAFLPELHEEAFDKLTRMIQDLARLTYTFGIHGPDLENTPWPALPSAGARANMGLGFNAQGNLSLLITPVVALTNTVTFLGNPLDGSNNTMYITRQAAYSGGTNGYVNTALRAQTNVTSASAASDEWAFLAVVNNSSLGTSGSQNTAVYGQINKLVAGAGDSWAATFESDDLSGAANPVYSQVACELDVWANGTDNNGVRLGLGIYAGPPPTLGGTAPVVNTGIFIGPVNGNTAAASYFQGINLYGVMTNGINVNLTAGSQVGLNTSNATLSAAALRIGSTQFIGFDASDGHRLGFSTGNGLAYTVSGTIQSVLTDTGAIELNTGITKITGTFSSGTAAPVLTANKPGAGTAISNWLSVVINGTQLWVPAWSN